MKMNLYFNYLTVLLLAVTHLEARAAEESPRPKVEIKWSPGHYLTLGWNQSREGWNDIAEKPSFAGGQRIYKWRQLEPEEGKYDFAGIEADLAYLRRQNQRLVLEVWDNSFHGESTPPVPDYLLGSAYKGGIAHPVGKPKVTRTKRWVPEVMNRYLLLLEALGKRFDKDPDFAGLVHTETAMEAKGKGFEDYTSAGFDQQMRRLVASSRKAFPHTPVIVFGNWYGHRGATGLADLANYAEKAGAGWGGPDLCPGVKIWGYDVIRAHGGRMPLGLAAQWESYKGSWTAPQLLDFAKELKLNFVFWGRFDRRKEGGLSFVKDVAPAIQAHGECLSTQRPANLGQTGL